MQDHVMVKGFILFLTIIYKFYKLFPRQNKERETWPMGLWKDGDQIIVMAITNEEKQVKKYSEETWCNFLFFEA